MDYTSLAKIFGPTIVDMSNKIKLDDLHIETEILTKVSLIIYQFLHLFALFYHQHFIQIKRF